VYQGTDFKALVENIWGLFDCLCGRTCGPQLLAPLLRLMPDFLSKRRGCRARRCYRPTPTPGSQSPALLSATPNAGVARSGVAMDLPQRRGRQVRRCYGPTQTPGLQGPVPNIPLSLKCGTSWPRQPAYHRPHPQTGKRHGAASGFEPDHARYTPARSDTGTGHSQRGRAEARFL
jgi:hypothetical protein